MSDDEREWFPTRAQLWRCTCGCEYDQLDPLPRCDCGHVLCPECTQRCRWCNQDGCETCMTNGIDGWAHKGECQEQLARHEDELPDRVMDRIKRAAERAADAA